MATLSTRLISLGDSLNNDLAYLQDSGIQVSRYDVYSWQAKETFYQKEIQTLQLESVSPLEDRLCHHLLNRIQSIFHSFKMALSQVVERNERQLAPDARTRSQKQEVGKTFVGLGLMKELFQNSGPLSSNQFEAACIYEAYTSQEIRQGDFGDHLRKALDDGLQTVAVYTDFPG